MKQRIVQVTIALQLLKRRGAGLAKHWKALDLIVAERIIWVCILTIQTTGTLAYDFYSLLSLSVR